MTLPQFCFVFWSLRQAYDESIFGERLSAALKSQGTGSALPPSQPTPRTNLACVGKREQPQQTGILKSRNCLYIAYIESVSLIFRWLWAELKGIINSISWVAAQKFASLPDRGRHEAQGKVNQRVQGVWWTCTCICMCVWELCCLCLDTLGSPFLQKSFHSLEFNAYIPRLKKYKISPFSTINIISFRNYALLMSWPTLNSIGDAARIEL